MNGIDLNDMALFVRVVDLGAFAKVARELSVPTSTISRAVARLEEKIGTALLQRSSRSLQVTTEGRLFYAQVAPAVAAMRHAFRSVSPSDQAPRGRLRVTAPNDVGATFLPEVVVGFAERYPLVDVELILTARIVNLVEEGIDVALRAGNLPDSSLIARRLGEMSAGLYAAPSYIAARGTPTTVGDLAEHACILFRASGGEATWVLRGPEGIVEQRVRGRISADDYLCVREAIAAGGGIGLLPQLLTYGTTETDMPARVLPTYSTAAAPFHLVYPPARVVPPKVAAFRDYMVAAFARFDA